MEISTSSIEDQPALLSNESYGLESLSTDVINRIVSYAYPKKSPNHLAHTSTTMNTHIQKLRLLRLNQGAPLLCEVSKQFLQSTFFQNYKDKILRLAFNDLDSPQDGEIQTIAQNCPNLLSIKAAECSGLTDASLKSLGTHCWKLTTLALARATQVTDVGLQSISSCTNLQTLKLKECKKITDVGFGKLVQTCTQLTSINIERCDLLTNASISSLVQYCPSVSSIKINNTKIDQNRIASLGQHYPNLSSIRIGSSTNTTVKQLVEACNNLSRITLIFSTITDTTIQTLGKQCSKLLYLKLWHCHNVTITGVKLLIKASPKLSKLTLRNCFEMDCKQVQALENNGAQLLAHRTDINLIIYRNFSDSLLFRAK